MLSYIGELESDLETAHKRMQFYRCSMDIINDLAKELVGIDHNAVAERINGILKDEYEPLKI